MRSTPAARAPNCSPRLSLAGRIGRYPRQRGVFVRPVMHNADCSMHLLACFKAWTCFVPCQLSRQNCFLCSNLALWLGQPDLTVSVTAALPGGPDFKRDISFALPWPDTACSKHPNATWMALFGAVSRELCSRNLHFGRHVTQCHASRILI